MARIVAAPKLSPLRIDLTQLAEGPALEPRENYENQWFAGPIPLDVQGMTLNSCLIADASLDDVDFAASTFTECQFTGLDAPRLRLPRTVLRDCEIAESRFGAADLAEADLFSTRVRDCKFTWINCSGGTLRDVLFEDCVIDEIDLSQATAQRVAFCGCRTAALRLDGARLTDVDVRGLDIGGIGGLGSLRGAVLTHEQTLHLAPVFAAFLGATVD